MGSPECTPTWQYILIMGDEITGLVNGLTRIGQYHKDAELKPMAEYLDGAVSEFRAKLEELTGWETAPTPKKP